MTKWQVTYSESSSLVATIGVVIDIVAYARLCYFAGMSVADIREKLHIKLTIVKHKSS